VAVGVTAAVDVVADVNKNGVNKKMDGLHLRLINKAISLYLSAFQIYRGSTRPPLMPDVLSLIFIIYPEFFSC
jgi:hypothetical protein